MKARKTQNILICFAQEKKKKVLKSQGNCHNSLAPASGKMQAELWPLHSSFFLYSQTLLVTSAMSALGLHTLK